MKSVRDQVWRKIEDDILDEIWHKTTRNVREQIEERVWNDVSSVTQFSRHIFNKINREINK